MYMLTLLNSTSFFTWQQLQKFHRQFIHPSAEKLYDFLKKARPNKAIQYTLDVLKDPTRRCNACQQIQSAPTRFRVPHGTENFCFNEGIYMHIMYIGHAPILRVVDASTNFSAARFLSDVNISTVWATFVECRASVRTGFPNRIWVVRRSCSAYIFFHCVQSCEHRYCSL